MSDDPRRLLMVAFHYPPDNTSTGVLRTLKFTQYLEEFGWMCDVLSVPETLYSSTDPASLEKIPDAVRVHRAWANDIKKISSIRGLYPAFLGVPDRYWLWIWPALRQAKRLLRGDHPFKAVFSTYPVPSALLIGLLLKKRHGLPWIADFRDPWVEDSMAGWEKLVGARIERAVLEQADRVVCNTPRMREWFMQRYPQVDADKLVTIPNGYDARELAEVIPAPLKKFQIFYGGVIDGENRNPRPLLAGVRHAIDQGWIDASQLHITFLGAGAYGVGAAFTQDVERLRLQDYIELCEQRIPYAQALQRAAGADVILVLSEALGDDEAAEKERQWSRLQVPVKVYEGLGMQRQILALVSDGAAKDILTETRSGVAVPPTDVEGIARALRRLYERWQAGSSAEAADQAQLEKYSRKSLAGRLAATLDELV